MRAAAQPTSNEAIAERLELTRKALDIALQQTFAEVIGITPQAYTNMLKDRARISIDTAIRLCVRYSVTLDWIYRGNSYGMPKGLIERIEEIASQIATKLFPREPAPNL